MSIVPTREIIRQQEEIIAIFKEFRQELMYYYGNISYDSKGDESPVTTLDIKIEKAVKKHLLAKFPDIGIQGEETEAVRARNGIVWYLDPIDSTLSFINGLPYCANMAACVVNGEVIASVVYHFATDDLFTAVKGQGAYKNGKRLTIQDRPLRGSCIFTDWYGYTHLHPLYGKEKVRLYAPVGATGYFLTRLAQGSIQGVCYMAANIKPHDVAPGALIAQEAGVEFISFEDRSFTHETRRFFAGTPSLCELTKQKSGEIITAMEELPGARSAVMGS